MNFVVTGMPRTGLAWLSVFLTTDTSICHPEPLKNMQSDKDIERLLGQRGHEAVGMADTALAFFPDVIQRVACPIIVLDRDLDECVQDLIGMALAPDVAVTYCRRIEAGLKKFRAMPTAIAIDSKKIKTPDVAQQILWHCMPGKSFDVERFDLLRFMMIEGNPMLTIEAQRNNQHGLAKLFGGRYEHLGAGELH